MMSEELISFRKDYSISSFPVAVKFYQCLEIGRCTLLSRLLHSPQELRAFQRELTTREPHGEWMFLAYYELDRAD
ncbi:MAG TPA: hypothetical protein DEV72_09445 [Ktedonobacter sp.]|nr:hypothetical protein [Ktedonobacter sp.]HCP73246.1 hypothetical protein [Ktedonobacter sp.]